MSYICLTLPSSSVVVLPPAVLKQFITQYLRARTSDCILSWMGTSKFTS
ncbi:hypothetical protein GCK32_022180 [Trichostrongylus colubriformis]|uniref:Uncharacterized protein n=1 Tax=Trichostrongylus colubriformis TaxID=6319 RepID=A0AAN8IW69_TRICO